MAAPSEVLIKVSRSAINTKLFNVTEAELRAKLKGDELTSALALLPTDEEREFMRIFTSTAPELARVQRKMSVCIEAEVRVLESHRVAYEYAGRVFDILAPLNSFRISEALEKGKHAAVSEMIKQGRITDEARTLTHEDAKGLDVDEVNLLIKITDRFFFQIFAA